METAQNKMTKETLGQLIIDSEETMYHIAKSLLYNDADCADAIQEAIVKAFAKLHTLKDDSYAKTWLIRIVMNECYAIMRKEEKNYFPAGLSDERAGNGIQRLFRFI